VTSKMIRFEIWLLIQVGLNMNFLIYTLDMSFAQKFLIWGGSFWGPKHPFFRPQMGSKTSNGWPHCDLKNDPNWDLIVATSRTKSIFLDIYF
jgi:hypothetical protein